MSLKMVIGYNAIYMKRGKGTRDVNIERVLTDTVKIFRRNPFGIMLNY